MKETLRMQMLAGIITESEYKAKLNEFSNSPLFINIYSPKLPLNYGKDGFIDLNSTKYNVNFDPQSQRAKIFLYNEYGGLACINSSDDLNNMKSHLDDFNISYKLGDCWDGGKTIIIDDVSSQNIELIYGGKKPKFKSKPKNPEENLKILDFFIERDNPKQIEGDPIYGDVYDFGGGENPIDEDDPQAVVVDLYLTSNQKENPSKFIEADLSKYIKLPPKNGINIFSAVAQINSPNNLAKTIKHALKPGGLLVIKDHIGAVQDLLKYLKDFKLLAFEYVDVEDLDDITLSDQIFVTLKK
jgi:hypothetical protein